MEKWLRGIGRHPLTGNYKNQDTSHSFAVASLSIDHPSKGSAVATELPESPRLRSTGLNLQKALCPVTNSEWVYPSDAVALDGVPRWGLRGQTMLAGSHSHIYFLK